MATPLGAIHTTNVTPDRETGIGGYSLADFDRAVRHGVAPGGRRLYPAMPYPSYAKLSDDDVRDLYAFFMKGVTPVRQANIPSDIPWPLNMRWPIALWNGVLPTPIPMAQSLHKMNYGIAVLTLFRARAIAAVVIRRGGWRSMKRLWMKLARRSWLEPYWTVGTRPVCVVITTQALDAGTSRKLFNS